MADPILVAEIRKNQRETIRVALDEYNGHKLISVRVWTPGEDGQARPTKAGIACRVALLPDLHDALGKALERARKAGTV